MQDSQSFGANDLLRVAELARSAHHRTNELRRDLGRDMRHDQTPDRDTRSETQRAFDERRQGRTTLDPDLSR